MKTIRVSTILTVIAAVLFTPLAEAQEIRGWSPQAKGAAIGAGVGGAAGAVINKRNRVVGGLIGAGAGAAGGYAIGKSQQRRPWSPQAKGTAIGAGAGAAAGAIINKRNRVVGGLIGAGAGAAGGYAIGKGIDNRRKANARIAAAEREAAEARREAAVARREAAAAADRPGVVTRPAAARVAAVERAAVPAVAGAGAGVLAASAFSAQNAGESYLNNTLFLANPWYGDPNSAYPTSEVRRKSW